MILPVGRSNWKCWGCARKMLRPGGRMAWSAWLKRDESAKRHNWAPMMTTKDSTWILIMIIHGTLDRTGPWSYTRWHTGTHTKRPICPTLIRSLKNVWKCAESLELLRRLSWRFHSILLFQGFTLHPPTPNPLTRPPLLHLLPLVTCFFKEIQNYILYPILFFREGDSLRQKLRASCLSSL